MTIHGTENSIKVNLLDRTAFFIGNEGYYELKKRDTHQPNDFEHISHEPNRPQLLKPLNSQQITRYDFKNLSLSSKALRIIFRESLIASKTIDSVTFSNVTAVDLPSENIKLTSLIRELTLENTKLSEHFLHRALKASHDSVEELTISAPAQTGDKRHRFFELLEQTSQMLRALKKVKRLHLKIDYFGPTVSCQPLYPNLTGVENLTIEAETCPTFEILSHCPDLKTLTIKVSNFHFKKLKNQLEKWEATFAGKKINITLIHEGALPPWVPEEIEKIGRVTKSQIRTQAVIDTPKLLPLTSLEIPYPSKEKSVVNQSPEISGDILIKLRMKEDELSFTASLPLFHHGSPAFSFPGDRRITSPSLSFIKGSIAHGMSVKLTIENTPASFPLILLLDREVSVLPKEIVSSSNSPGKRSSTTSLKVLSFKRRRHAVGPISSQQTAENPLQDPNFTPVLYLGRENG